MITLKKNFKDNMIFYLLKMNTKQKYEMEKIVKVLTEKEISIIFNLMYYRYDFLKKDSKLSKSDEFFLFSRQKIATEEEVKDIDEKRSEGFKFITEIDRFRKYLNEEINKELDFKSNLEFIGTYKLIMGIINNKDVNNLFQDLIKVIKIDIRSKTKVDWTDVRFMYQLKRDKETAEKLWALSEALDSKYNTTQYTDFMKKSDYYKDLMKNQ